GLAMEKAKSTDSLVYTKEIPAVDNPPGEEVDDILIGLEKVRAGVKINFQGAGSICDFDARGDQLNRHFGHFRIEKGKQVLVQIIKGPQGKIGASICARPALLRLPTSIVPAQI